MFYIADLPSKQILSTEGGYSSSGTILNFFFHTIRTGILSTVLIRKSSKITIEIMH